MLMLHLLLRKRMQAHVRQERDGSRRLSRRGSRMMQSTRSTTPVHHVVIRVREIVVQVSVFFVKVAIRRRSDASKGADGSHARHAVPRR